MAFENDPEGRQIAERYAGPDFDKPHDVTFEVLRVYHADWSLAEFQALLATVLDRVPEEYRSTTRIQLDDPGFDSRVSLLISYTGLESAAAVADRVSSCEQYVADTRTAERAMFNRLRAKFDGSPLTDDAPARQP